MTVLILKLKEIFGEEFSSRRGGGVGETSDDEEFDYVGQWKNAPLDHAVQWAFIHYPSIFPINLLVQIPHFQLVHPIC